MASRIINMTISEDLISVVDELAEEEGRTRSELFREAVRRYVEQRKPGKKSGSRLLSRLAALSKEGPKLSAKDIDGVLYQKGKTR